MKLNLIYTLHSLTKVVNMIWFILRPIFAKSCERCCHRTVCYQRTQDDEPMEGGNVCNINSLTAALFYIDCGRLLIGVCKAETCVAYISLKVLPSRIRLRRFSPHTVDPLHCRCVEVQRVSYRYTSIIIFWGACWSLEVGINNGQWGLFWPRLHPNFCQLHNAILGYG